MTPALRPVPFRPPGPVDAEQAARHVEGALPELDEGARRALALVEVAGRPRDVVAAELSLGADALADALHRGRKALRRSVFPLSSTGWCERAERLLSDHLDGALAPPGPARLDAHLRHCGRCVEHERRLAQARDGLVRGYADLHGPPEREAMVEKEPPAPSPPPPALRIVPDAGLPAVAEPPARAEPILLPPAEPEPEAAVLPEVEPPRTPLEAPPHDGRVVVGIGSQGSRLWSALHMAAIALAVLTVLLTVLAATGAVERVF
ncbi:MAG: zf-HC2 domain-containing protein [Thermoleophilaceae bacterium]